jgi:hypothetical protein
MWVYPQDIWHLMASSPNKMCFAVCQFVGAQELSGTTAGM